MNLVDYEKYYHSGSEFIIPRDEFEKIIEENQRLNDDINILLKENEAKEKVIIKYDNVLNELEKWLNEYYESNRKWYNYELTTHDRNFYEREYRNTEFMIVKFIKQLNELKESDK